MAGTKKPTRKIITHSGSFHADDIFSAAVVSILCEKRKEPFEIIRTREPQIVETGDFVFDVGGVYEPSRGRFDHHQKGGAGSRDEGTGIPYAAFGLVWKQFGEEVAGSAEVAAIIDKKLVQSVDTLDNGFAAPKALWGDTYPYMLDHAFFAFHPTWKEDRPGLEDAFFLKLVSFARDVLLREIVRARDSREALDFLVVAYESGSDRRLLVLEKEYPWKDFAAAHPDILFVVFPNISAGTWGVSAVRKNPNEFGNRKDLPVPWAGKRDGELGAATGVSDAVFCHNKLFFAVAKSREGALALARQAMV